MLFTDLQKIGTYLESKFLQEGGENKNVMHSFGKGKPWKIDLVLTPIHIQLRNKLQVTVCEGALLVRGFQQLVAEPFARARLGDKKPKMVRLHKCERFH